MVIVSDNIPFDTISVHDATKPFSLPNESIDVCVTSPPYWGLRDYGVNGQIGLECHPTEYINNMVAVARNVRKVLKKTGSFYLNIGDTYFGGGTGQDKSMSIGKYTYGQFMQSVSAINKTRKNIKFNKKWLQPKQLMLIPSRVAIALQDDGWVLRNDIIWHKPNAMPTSVQDRLNNTYEHFFHFVKSRRYYYNLDAIRIPSKTTERRPYGIVRNRLFDYDSKINRMKNEKMKKDWDIKNGSTKRGQPRIQPNRSVSQTDEFRDDRKPMKNNPLGKNIGDVLSICTKPFTGYRKDMEHFAVFPEELIEVLLKSGCPECGTVLDPFCGRGTVGRVAKSLGMNYVLFDIKEEYVKLSELFVKGQKRSIIENQSNLFSGDII